MEESYEDRKDLFVMWLYVARNAYNSIPVQDR